MEKSGLKKTYKLSKENKPLEDSIASKLPNWIPNLLLICLILMLGYLHFPTGFNLQRKLIDYDDLEVVAKMMNLDLSSYFNEWLPNRIHYAFPVRDITIFFDKWLSPQTEGQFWISNFVLFSLCIFLFSLILKMIFSNYGPLNLALLTLYALHPIQTEVVQWITCRKYLVGLPPILLGTWMVIRWKGQELTPRRIAGLTVVWLLSLASYPTAAFWILWALFFIQRKNPLKNRLPLYVLFFAITALYLFLVGHGTLEVNSSLTNIISNYKKSFHFGYNALGRGFFNLVLPFWTFSYYRENHPFTFIGLTLLVVFLLFIKTVSHRVLSLSYESNCRQHLIEAGVWLLGGVSFLIPISNTILGFFDFMLADRHLFFSMPFFIIATGYFFLFLKELFEFNKPEWKIGVPVIFTIWIGISLFSIASKVPLWKDDFELMKNCAIKEGSARCMSQTVRRRFFKSDCASINDTLLQAADFYKQKPPFSFEFSSEIPFYHAACISLNSSIPREKKEAIIESLERFYDSSPEIIFGLVLSSLENGNMSRAMDLASQYYLGDLSLGPISATRTLQAVYAGQLTVLCQLNPSPLCSSRLNHFLLLHPEAIINSGAGSWGREATLIMAKRGGLK